MSTNSARIWARAFAAVEPPSSGARPDRARTCAKPPKLQWDHVEFRTVGCKKERE